ncbi:MAG: ABC transporter substrate-binding protein [Patescibacteria group bacterium]
MKKVIIWLVVIVVVIGIAVLASKNPEADNAVKLERPVKIGVIIPLSGAVASMGEPIKNAINLQTYQNILPMFEDDPCDAKKAISAYQKLKLENVRIFYVACSGSVMALAPLAQQNGDLILTAYAGSAEIRKTGTEVIRFIPDALSVGEAMVEHIKTIPENKKIGLLHEEQDYAQSLANLLQENLGSKILTTEKYNANDNTYRTQVTKLKFSGIDTLLFVPTSDKAAQLVLKEMQVQSFKPEIISEVNTCDYPFKPADYGLHGVCWKASLDTAGYEKYVSDYKAKYGKDSQYPFYDSITFDLFGILDTFYAQDLSIEQLKAKILAGITGQVSSYQFDSAGEVNSSQYLKVLSF